MGSFGLGRVYDILNVEEGNQEEIKIKKVFSYFCKWFLRKRYPVYLVKESRVTDKKISYVKGKNILMYLPNVTTHCLKKLRRRQ